MENSRTAACSLTTLILGLMSSTGLADEPAKPARDPLAVAANIDREIDRRLKEAGILASPAADDAEFLRRIYLDLTGRIPTREQAETFLDSTAADKRAKLIDELLASPNYGKHLASIWHDLIVRRDDANRQLRTDAFRNWLADSFNENRGWDRIVSDMLTAEGNTPQATFFIAHRDMNRFAPNKLVGTTANLFMGLQLQCAECHKHPFIHTWKQEDFWSTAAFFSRVRAANTSVDEKAPSVIRTVTGAAIEIPDATDPRKKTGRVVKARYFEGEAPELDDKGPFRAPFASWLTGKDNKFFAPTAVNRLWAHFLARGLVNPLDDMHDDNPPSHPELFRLLANEFRESGHDIKHMIHCICNSRVYQRTSQPIKGNENDVDRFAHQAVKVMSPEVLYDALTTALGVTEIKFEVQPNSAFGQIRTSGNARQQFIALFTTREGGEESSELGFGIPQYLRLMNAASFNKGGPVLDQLLKENPGREKVITALFLSTLARRPTPDEMKKFSEYVSRKNDSKAAYTGALWVLINSAEFLCVR